MVVSCPHKCSVQTLLRSEVRPNQEHCDSGPVCYRLHSSELRASRDFVIDCGNVCTRADKTDRESVEVRRTKSYKRFRVENPKN